MLARSLLALVAAGAGLPASTFSAALRPSAAAEDEEEEKQGNTEAEDEEAALQELSATLWRVHAYSDLAGCFTPLKHEHTIGRVGRHLYADLLPISTGVLPHPQPFTCFYRHPPRNSPVAGSSSPGWQIRSCDSAHTQMWGSSPSRRAPLCVVCR